MEFIGSWMHAEIKSRRHSKITRLVGAAGLPSDKELDGYDWTPIRFPWTADGNDSKRSISSTILRASCRSARRESARPTSRSPWADGPAGTWFPPASPPPRAVMRLLRAQSGNRLDRELAAIGGAGLPIIDEQGHIPIDEEVCGLLFQAADNTYETQSIINHQHRVRRMGQDLRPAPTWPPPSSTGPSIMDG
jgi:hypothetical protein